MREIKFRVWDKTNKKMCDEKDFIMSLDGYVLDASTLPFTVRKDCVLLQYTGLKDKNNLQEVHEGDIIDSNGNIKGNIYQMDKGKTYLVIQGFGTKTWCETYRRAVFLGCKDAE